MKRVLILVDIQNDFLPGGALAVRDGDQVIAIANRLQPFFPLVVATQDWHPRDHVSFAENHARRQPFEQVKVHGCDQTLWPAHCVQDTHGAAFADTLDQSRWTRVVRKGSNSKVDSYSGFVDNGGKLGTGLEPFLRDADVTDVYVLGLATDYCVKFTALDACRLGFRTYVIKDGCRAVGDSDAAFDEMRRAGVIVISSGEIDSGCCG